MKKKNETGNTVLSHSCKWKIQTLLSYEMQEKKKSQSLKQKLELKQRQ